jgi:hypothetical protein
LRAGLLLFASAVSLVVSLNRPSSNFAVAAGAALGISILAWPAAIWLMPVLLVSLADRRYPPAVRRALAASALFGLALPFAGWLLYRALGPADSPFLGAAR